MIALPELISGTVESVGPRLRDIVDHATHVAPIFSIEVGYDLQLRNRVLIAEKERWAADRVVIIVLAVQLIVI